MEVLVEHDRLKKWKKLKGGEVWYINQLLDPTKERLITWQQVKKLSNQRSSRKKATWFQSIENITLENSNTRKVKEEFKTQSPNGLALKLQRKPISKKRSKREWVIVDKNKENQPIIGRVMTKRTHITDIICYEISSKNEKQTGERSSNKVLRERLINGVKRARMEKLIDISPWVKYTKGEMNLQLEPDYFVKREKGSSISSEQVRSLRSRKEEIRVVIEEPSLVLIDRIVEGQEKRWELKAALVENWEENILWFYTDGSCKVVNDRKVLGYGVVQIDREGKVVRDTKGRIQNWISSTRPELMAILEALLMVPPKCRVTIRSDSSTAIILVKKVLGEPRI